MNVAFVVHQETYEHKSLTLHIRLLSYHRTVRGLAGARKVNLI